MGFGPVFQEAVIGVSLFHSSWLWQSFFWYFLQSLLVALIGFFLLSTQSPFYLRPKRNLKEIVGYEKLGKAVGWMEMLCVVGILAGAFTGAVLFDQFVGDRNGWGRLNRLYGSFWLWLFFHG